MKSRKLRIGITHGDINGIGYEIILKVLSEQGITDYFTPIVYGSSKAIAFYKKLIKNNLISGLNFNIVKSAESALPKRLNIVNVSDENFKVEPGISSDISGKASIEALELAVEDLKSNFLDCIVTCPIDMVGLQSEQNQFPGHTEYFAKCFDTEKTAMLMVNELMKIGFVTNHIPFSEVKEHITQDLIFEKLEIINKTLIQDFNIRKPKIAVLGLNPHAGNMGNIGNEEIEIITPVINKARDKNLLVFGPYSADDFFVSKEYQNFDVVLAMYHDQGMIPFKAIGQLGGVMYTAGLPIVRTSTSHGVEYDIVGQNIASEQSLSEALFLARDISINRFEYTELNQNALNYDKNR